MSYILSGGNTLCSTYLYGIFTSDLKVALFIDPHLVLGAMFIKHCQFLTSVPSQL